MIAHIGQIPNHPPTQEEHFLGVDPDLHTTAVALVNHLGRPIWLSICEVDKKLLGREAAIWMAQALPGSLRGLYWSSAAVESQEVTYTGRAGGNPRDIVLLAHVGGSALTAVSATPMTGALFFPSPAEWKGQIPKQIHQARVCRDLGWHAETRGSGKGGYIRPSASAYPNEHPMMERFEKENGVTGWKHMLDAIALARWCRQQQIDNATKALALAKARG